MTRDRKITRFSIASIFVIGMSLSVAFAAKKPNQVEEKMNLTPPGIEELQNLKPPSRSPRGGLKPRQTDKVGEMPSMKGMKGGVKGRKPGNAGGKISKRPPQNTSFNGSAGFVTVMPEVSTAVEMSSTDINRVVCQKQIRDVIYSEEKGVSVTLKGNNAYVKFMPTKRMVKGKREIIYTKTPSELYFVCGSSTYSMVAVPKKIMAQTIMLSSGKMSRIRENAENFEGVPYDDKIVTVLRSVMRNDIPESYETRELGIWFDLFQDIGVLLKREISVEGEGLKVKEYYLSLKQGLDSEVLLHEKFFLLSELSDRAVGVALMKHSIGPNEIVRLFIVESANTEFGMGILR